MASRVVTRAAGPRRGARRAPASSCTSSGSSTVRRYSRAVEAGGQLRGGDLELLRVLLDVQRHELRAVPRLPPLPGPLQRGAGDHLGEDAHEQRVAGHVGVVGPVLEVAARQPLDRLHVGERVVAGHAHHVVGAQGARAVDVPAQHVVFVAAEGREPRATGHLDQGVVLRADRGGERDAVHAAARRPCARAAPPAAAGRPGEPGPCPGSATRPCARRRPRRGRPGSLQHLLADGLVGLDGPRGAPADHAVRLARRDSRARSARRCA